MGGEGEVDHSPHTQHYHSLKFYLATSTQIIVYHALQLAVVQFSANSEPFVLWCSFFVVAVFIAIFPS